MFVNGLRSFPCTKVWVGVVGIAALLTGCGPNLTSATISEDLEPQARVHADAPTASANQRPGSGDIPKDEQTTLTSLSLDEESEENIYVAMSGQWLDQYMAAGLTKSPDGSVHVNENVSAILALQALGYSETAASLAADLSEPQSIAALVGVPESLQVGEAAQVIVAVAAVGGSTANLGGRDLLAELESAMSGTWGTPDVGSVEQAWAMIALAYSAEPSWEAMEQFIFAQCDDGGFPQNFDGAGQCAGDVKITARVLSALTLSLNSSPTTDSAPYAPISKDAVRFLNHAAHESADGTVFWVNPKTKSASLELTSAATVALADASLVNPGTADFLFNRLAAATDGGAVTVNGRPNVAATAQTLIGLTAAGLSQF